jgi:hypothetical protein
MNIGILRLSDMLMMALAGETVKVPATIGMAKFYRNEIEKFVLENTTEPILIAIAPDHSHIVVKKYPAPLPIEDLTKS